MNIRKAAALLGKKGGKSTSDAKRQASRRNGKKGGRPAGSTKSRCQQVTIAGTGLAVRSKDQQACGTVASGLKTAHRMMHIVTHGEIGLMEVDHLCRNTICVNPNHLEAVTKAENIRRGLSASANNARLTHCHRGHELSEENIWHYPYKRICKLCRQINERNRYERKISSRSSSRAEDARG